MLPVGLVTDGCRKILSLLEKNKILILSALDNLVKGAGGQAIQNMNIVSGLRENLGFK